MDQRRIALAAGVTAGHINLALATASEFQRRYPDADIVFIGCRGGPEQRLVPRAGLPFVAVSGAAFNGRGPLAKARALRQLAAGTLQARSALAARRTQLVVGFGGYASAAALLASKALGLVSAIHEANAFPGLTNRVFARFADRIFLGYEAAGARLAQDKLRVTGNPVRPDIARLACMAPKASNGPVQVLVTGGSWGSPFLNASAPALLGRLGALGVAVRALHQAGSGVDDVQARYRDAGVPANVVDYIDDMSDAYARSAFVIGCAGAVTLAELAFAALPALLVPLGQAAEGHQRDNAIAFTSSGAGWWVSEQDWNAGALAPKVAALLRDDAVWQAAAQAARTLMHPDAAGAIVTDCEQLMAAQWR